MYDRITKLSIGGFVLFAFLWAAFVGTLSGLSFSYAGDFWLNYIGKTATHIPFIVGFIMAFVPGIQAIPIPFAICTWILSFFL